MSIALIAAIIAAVSLVGSQWSKKLRKINRYVVAVCAAVSVFAVIGLPLATVVGGIAAGFFVVSVVALVAWAVLAAASWVFGVIADGLFSIGAWVFTKAFGKDGASNSFADKVGNLFNAIAKRGG